MWCLGSHVEHGHVLEHIYGTPLKSYLSSSPRDGPDTRARSPAGWTLREGDLAHGGLHYPVCVWPLL